jgi:hypothetical protein
MVQQNTYPLRTRPRRRRSGPRAVVWTMTVLVLAAATVIGAGVAWVAKSGTPAAAAAAVKTRQPAATTSVLAGSPAVISDNAATMMLADAPAVVVTSLTSRPAVSAAAATALRAYAPLLLMPAGSGAELTALRSAIRLLHPSAVLAAGVPAAALSADLPGVRVVTSAAALPRLAAATPIAHLTVLVHKTNSAAGADLATAAATTAAVAGARVVAMPGYDPQTVPAAIRALAAARPTRVIAVGARFGSAHVVGARVAVAETGVQLPGGGQLLFPMRRIVALYGNPEYPALGVLGHQSLPASIVRAREVAAQYNRLSKVPVIPAFEIIATVASASPGLDDDYSYEMSVASLRPWVDAAARAHMYVTLDLQPGRASFLTEAKHYQSLLERPDVGLALDPEWKLGPHQLPLKQIGSVSIAEVNSVVSWLARLTARDHLPQKLLELHEFRLSMIQNIQDLDRRHGDLAIVINMDGQGAPSTKQQTWDAVIANAPKGVYFGWKDFTVKDTPMLDPEQTIERTPEPVLISYQ